MTWVRIDDAFYNHPKVASMPSEFMLPAVGLHLLALCYCNQNLTDGFIPDPQIARLAGDLTLLLPNGTVDPLVIALEAGGLWESDPERGGYVVHDYLDYNPSRREVLLARRKLSLERSKAGRLGMQARWGSKNIEIDDNKPIATPLQEDNPGPGPGPGPIEESKALSRSRTTTRGQNGNEPPRKHREEARKILGWLNEKACKNFATTGQAAEPHLLLIEARLAGGAAPWQLRKVVTSKVKEWADDPKTRVWLRPATLFNRTKCQNYLGELPPPGPEDDG